ncbi:MAG: 4Fe-4S dicluster domain-containing protein, partial [Planctomycetes bacterium]|nr:4Fe-4S dicluster domain-containing protein [Planctomycetota bacterium]
VQANWLATVKPAVGAAADDRAFWNGALARGVVGEIASAKAAALTFDASALSQAPAAKAAAGAYQLVISASRVLRDGACANNAWLQEIPDPVSKITWDNYAALSVAHMAEFGVDRQTYDDNWANPVVEITANGRTLRLPVHFQEGMHPGTVEVFSGWGRGEHAGKVAVGAGVDGDGANADAFRLIGADGARWGIAAEVKATGATYRLACTQGHSTMDGRDIVRDDVLELHRDDPGKHHREHHHALWKSGKDGAPAGNLSLWHETHTYARRWGMVVDLNTCIGCQACVVACQVENNVPVVGRDEVRKGREMHWIRIDRYYSSPAWSVNPTTPAEGPTSSTALFAAPLGDALLDVECTQMPVMCMHCAHAPCEEVCPAMATMHNEEGVNVQIYNRCIGTRYCSNNCPYKVRRFNFYEYSKYRSGPHGAGSPFTRIAKNLVSEGATSSQAELSRAPLQMLLNPVVTVRSKGVMEKCNFCVQRTRDIREEEKSSGRKYRDGSVTTACAQTCPTGAISFGDIHDSEAAVTKLATSSPHAYLLLDKELNTRPAVAYLHRLRNRPATGAERAEGHGAPAAGHEPAAGHHDAAAPAAEGSH